MGPVGHTVISSAAGGVVWAVSDSPEAGVLTVGVGVLMDLDHLYDYYQWYIRRKRNRIYVLLHAWEYSVVGVVLPASVLYHPLFLAAVVAQLSHVATDHFHNRLSRFGYSIIYRLLKGFDAAQVSPHYDVVYAYRSWPRLVPLGKRLEPWFQRRIEPWFANRIDPKGAEAVEVYPPGD